MSSEITIRPCQKWPTLFPADYEERSEAVLRGIVERLGSVNFESLWRAGKLSEEEGEFIICLLAEQDMLSMGLMENGTADLCRHVLITIRAQQENELYRG